MDETTIEYGRTRIQSQTRRIERTVVEWCESALDRMHISQCVSFIISGAIIFGGIIPYVPQYLRIRDSNSNEGFSTYVCLTLLVANILRIAFWFGAPFELDLLMQSVVMIFGMLIMMELCIRVRPGNLSTPQTNSDSTNELLDSDEMDRKTIFSVLGKYASSSILHASAKETFR